MNYSTDISQNIMLSEESQTQRVHDIPKNAENIQEEIIARAGGERRALTIEGNESTSEDRNALHLDCSAGYMIYMCQNTSNCTSERVNFAVCKLYFSKPNLRKYAVF